MSSAMYTEYYVQLVNARTGSAIDDDTGKFIVMEAGVSDLQTIYSDGNGTVPAFTYLTVANTMTDGIIQFWTDVSVTSVDVTVRTANGESVFLKGLTPSQHRVEINTEKAEQMLILPFYTYIPTPFTSASITITASNWTTGITLPAKTLVKDCWAKVVNTGTGSTWSFGVSATLTGLLGVVTGDVTGYKYAMEPYVSSTATFTKGALLVSVTGFKVVPYLVSAVTTPTFMGSTTTLKAAGGYLYITYDKLFV